MNVSVRGGCRTGDVCAYTQAVGGFGSCLNECHCFLKQTWFANVWVVRAYVAVGVQVMAL